ncbi:Retrovirus-related Pol polyprotein from transposon TNT 1-94 [Sesamum angolense]|uniref:Retrovirus-related Pol polyprotein from transposon TNT 1-94 n=1 Tax=Sesamum angolense TaxID=2727404 RepID=A0AAE1W835_9LAMI|nr:Retrovirus-related Pol polyprotein from transposon TNT 1-94 [Sesamum angolense]
MANEKRCEIQGLGDIYLTFKDSYKLTLKNVRYVPDLNHNLTSCAALEEEGLEGRWGKGIMKIMKRSLTVFKADRRRNLYVCSVNYDILAASVTDYDKTSLWHKRLGHISLKGLELLQKEGVLIDKIEKLKFCDECVMGKQHKVQFPASQIPNPSSSSGILDYVHADVWGPSNTPTHGEFCNQNFSDLCDECGTKRHRTNPYTPQQNGVAERMNRTLLEKVRCMLISSGLPKSFWGEALVTAAYLINRFPSVPLNGKIPETM